MNVWQSWILVLGLFMSSCWRSQAQKPPPSDEHNAVRLLAAAERIETARIWEDAIPSAQSQAFSFLLVSQEADRRFVSLFESASGLAGQVYALLGLSACNPEKYRVLAKDLAAERVVAALWYDVMREIRVGEILQMIDDGTLYSAVCSAPTKAISSGEISSTGEQAASPPD